MKTRIDWALGADVRVRDATHNGGEWLSRLCGLVHPAIRDAEDRRRASTARSSDSGFADAGGTGDPPNDAGKPRDENPARCGSG
jgi:hypothetical protein